MSTPPAHSASTIPDQDQILGWIQGLLAAVTASVLEEQPGLGRFIARRPARNRSSGGSWRGQKTSCYVSELLASAGVPDLQGENARDLLAAADTAARAHGMHLRSEHTSQGISSASWATGRGDLLEVIVGVRVAVRAISAPCRVPSPPGGPPSVPGLPARPSGRGH